MCLPKPPKPPSATGEFAGADLGDHRLHRRVEQIVSRLEARPDASFPDAMRTEAEIEAFYRFVRNDNVPFEALFEPHQQATVGRCARHGTVLAVHDTSEFRFNGEQMRDGLGELGRSGKGFLGHLVLAMTPGSTREPLGVLHVEQLTRTKGKMSPTKLIKEDLATYAHTLDMEKEEDRWGRGVREVARVVDDSRRVIHVMDSEADDYKLMTMMAGGDGLCPQRFVLRLRYDRALDLERSGAARVSGAIQSHPVVATREVFLSRRKRGPSADTRSRQAQREGRPAILEMRAADVALKRPGHYPKRGLPEALSVNVVEVREADPPEGQEPFEWLLVTTEPIDTPEQITALAP